ncbi:dihydrofolate reductase family protein [Corynebacterium hindlerae]|uniref:Dihydrofolate reductase family protein n=1 Tax=Corynebacterium hindlerae TaxID=699041 RepID=A0A7G5FFP7_9CORY|nr:dihydrofolate reductase family protein [Corynebacterium hindlerae]QMV85438.1 dihydrofolate reductase family protein [Corynebacterium hindlerae]QTH58681.1 dihydrofolate reductase family protein [Corynebacterium hindlerae]
MLSEMIGPLRQPDEFEVRMIAVVTADGQISHEGTSASLGSALDAELLLALREWADVVLVGAGTVRAEDYGGVGGDDPSPLAVVSSSLDFQASARVFREARVQPLFLTTNDDPSAHHRIEAAGGTVVPCDGDFIDVLRARGFRRIVVEGGPSLYRQVLARGEVDVIHLTIDPSLSLASTAPLLPSDSPDRVALDLEHCVHDDEGCVFLRYRVRN